MKEYFIILNKNGKVQLEVVMNQCGNDTIEKSIYGNIPLIGK